jgi:hypothetical protein
VKIAFLVILFSIFSSTINAQHDSAPSSIDSIVINKRKKAFVIGTTVAYSASSIGLYYAWYRKYDQEPFHFFNDWGEWNNMDKLGHTYSSYFQSDILFQMGQWSGINDQQALKIACLTSLGFQSAFEIMDGFSSRWGFSVPDIAANIFGTGSFYLQQKIWHEQRVRMKFSYWPIDYPDGLIYSETEQFSFTLEDRATALYGKHFLERLVKDYNAQTIWLSVNLKSFIPKSSLPDWLNIAIGFGSKNLYGGFENRWEINDENIIVSEKIYPRFRQYIVSPDIDFSKIKSNSPFVHTILSLLNTLKLPAPAFVIDSQGKIGFSLFFQN